MSELSPGDAVTVIRSEERLVARTEAVPVQRAVLRKVIVSEERTVTVTVRHEEFRIDYEPVEGEATTVQSTGEPFDLVLHEEQIKVTTSVVPVERVRVAVRQVVEDRVLTEQVRIEQVALDGVPEAAPQHPRHQLP